MDPQERKKAILDAAKSVFAEKGYHQAGVADVIERAGIARGTFYLYFKSKHEVFSALVEYIIQTIDEKLVAPTFDDTDAILQCVKENLDRVKAVFAEDPDLARIIIHETTALEATSRERLGEIQLQLVRWMSGLVQQAQAMGILRPLDPDIIAYSFLGAIKELIENHLVSGYLKAEGAQITSVLLDLYMFGLITEPYQPEARDNFAQVQKQSEKNSENSDELIN